LAKLNPYRNKRLKGCHPFLFRIRISGKRIVYLVDKPQIKLICILDRKNNYNDLERYLKRHSML
jgi:mRNA-degrading endonuclease RelE of RelBE toxin-antitoxin system